MASVPPSVVVVDPTPHNATYPHKTYLQRLQERLNNTEERNLAIYLLVVAVGCALFSGIVYVSQPHRTITLTSTLPFIEFTLLPDVFRSTKTVRDLFTVNTTLLKTAWCDEPSGNPARRWANKAPACGCINSEWLKMMDEAIPLYMNSTLNSNLSAYLREPWINNTQILTFLIDYVNNTSPVAAALPEKYASTIVHTCMYDRAVWKTEKYETGLHPALSSFYCSVSLFVFALSYLMRVPQEKDTTDSSQWVIIAVGVVSVISFFIIDSAKQWFYGFAILYVCLNFIIAFRDEFTAIESTEEAKVTNDMFFPPHPLMLGTWYYIQIFFPVLITYLGLSNLIHDLVGLVTYYIIGYIVVTSIQRLFWVKWYMRQGNKLVRTNETEQHTHHTLIERFCGPFREYMEISLLVIFCLVLLISIVMIFVEWYPQTFTSGNWFGMVNAFILIGAMAVELLNKYPDYAPGDMLPMSIISRIQVILIGACTFLFSLSVWIDTGVN